jgi:hypothetical protein
MYLAAQRVRAPSGREGINAFFYRHGRVWLGPPPPEVLPEQDPGELVHTYIEVPPPGNRVRSYLDVVAPDGTSSAELVRWARDLLTMVEQRPLPWVVAGGDCVVHFGLEKALLPSWNAELGGLLRAALRALRGRQPSAAQSTSG